MREALLCLRLCKCKNVNVNVISYLPTKHQRALGTRPKVSVRSRSNWNLVMLVFVEGGKPENPEKNPRSRDENQQQTQPTYDAESENRTRAALVGGECSHHCAIPAPTLAALVKTRLKFPIFRSEYSRHLGEFYSRHKVLVTDNTHTWVL